MSESGKQFSGILEGGTRVYRQIVRVVDGVARGLAIVGGLLLVGVIALTCISIAGRALVPLGIGLGPIRGIYDMTEIAMAAAIFAFLPWAQLTEAHARVDLFRPVMPKVFNRALDLLFNFGMFVVALVGAWRLYLGMQDKLAYGEITLIAQIPVWQGFATALVGAVGFVIVAAFCVVRSGRRLAGLPD